MKQIILVLLVVMFCWQTGSAQSWQWVQQMGGSSADPQSVPDETVLDIDTDALGNVYVCGKIRNNAFFDNQQVLTYGGDDIFLAKYDCLGNLIWVEIAGSAQTTERATALVVNGEDIYLTGYKRGNSSQPFVMGDTSIAMSTSGFFLAKYDTSGNFKWVRADGGQGFIALGRDITQSWKNTIIVYGATTDSLLPGFPRNGSIFAAHFDYDGNYLYAQTLNDDINAVADFDNYAVSSIGDQYYIGNFTSDSIIVQGQTFHSQSGFSDLLLVKLDSNAVFQWAIQHGDSGGFFVGYGVYVDDNDDVFVTGRSQGNSYIDTFQLINSLSTLPLPISFSAKINPNGQLIWASNIEISAGSEPTGKIVANSNGTISFSGYVTGQAIIGSNTFFASNRDIYIAEFDATTGIPIKGDVIPGSGTNDEPQAIAADADGNIYIGGGFNGSLYLPFDTLQHRGGQTDAFLAKWGNLCTVGIEENSTANEQGLLIYPNPATAYVHLYQVDLKGIVDINIYNITGAQVHEQTIKITAGQVIQIPVQHLPKGLYLITVQSKNNRYSAKIVVQ